MTKITTAESILEWLGNNRFIAMTGCKNLVYDENSLSMNIPKIRGNENKTNYLKIEYDNNQDLYKMTFRYFTAGRLNKRTWEWSEGKNEVIAEFENVFGDRMKSIFTSITGLDTTL